MSNVNTQVKAKFTAALLHEADKNRIIKMRDESGLSEKDLMTLIVDAAEAVRETIIAQGKTVTETSKAEREVRRLEKYEMLKQAMKQARESAKANADKRQTEKSATPVDQAPEVQEEVNAEADASEPSKSSKKIKVKAE